MDFTQFLWNIFVYNPIPTCSHFSFLTPGVSVEAGYRQFTAGYFTYDSRLLEGPFTDFLLGDISPLWDTTTYSNNKAAYS